MFDLLSLLRSLMVAIAVMIGMICNVGAEQINVITSGAFSVAFKQLVPIFEQKTGHQVNMFFGASMGSAPDSIPTRLGRGEAFDVLILAGPALAIFIDQGVVLDGTRVDLANSTIGAVVRKGAPKPDISTVDALRNTLLQAKSIAYSASASGTYLSAEVFPKLGIADQLKDTARKIYSERVATVVARGDAELGFQQLSELFSIEGVDFIGELPPQVQQTIPFSAGIVKQTQKRQIAQELIGFFASEEAAPIIRKTGMHPLMQKMPW
ncbi:ABC transporter substrate-binding protein [Orrella sp. NBD-18]|uniref:ABC transporter substrate-binding protein n=1 Tax=Sheuella amnicola TaxID=2707330 RepID=A0A6B2R248_9BURK|nr:substrate-binding domain-containing protein [Sheuella amnicola]NDY84302.1 ABC transporter substrate-binding protein [Sheuella amnicola]HBI82860.1 molybdenum ABC transporter substrate-binding protein [Alcaligenaceae bacterium]